MNQFVHRRFVVVVVAQRVVNLRQRQVRVLEMDFLRAPPVGNHVQCHFDDLCVRVINPRRAALVEADMTCGDLTGVGLLMSFMVLDLSSSPSEKSKQPHTDLLVRTLLDQNDRPKLRNYTQVAREGHPDRSVHSLSSKAVNRGPVTKGRRTLKR